MGTYEPCVLGSDGNCTRWSHDHAADRPSVTDNARAETTTATIEEAARAIHDRHCTSDDHGPHCMFWDEDYESAEALHARGLLATTRTATIEDAARVLVRETTSGLCEYGRVCDECDCFADAGGRERDAHALELARAMDREGLLATARTVTTEDVARVLDDVIQHLRKIWSTGHDEAREVIDAAEELLTQALPHLATARARPTREQIDRAVGGVLSNASNHPDPVAVLGRSIAPLRNKITDAVLELLQDSTR